MQEEDAAAAGYCARLCETLRGAEAFAESDGLDAFISVAMGQSMKGNGGLMVALAQALAMDMTPFKEAVFETLCAAAQWPSLKGRIAGSGVLGVITATLLSPRHPATVKALMVRLCGLLAADSLEAISLGDARRAEEFSKLRGQLISSGAIKAIVGLLAASEGPAAAAAATAVVQLALAGDAAIRTELLQADAATALLRCAARLSKAGTEEMSDSDAETEEDAAPEAATAALARLLAFDGDGCQELLAPVLEPGALKDFCDALHGNGQRRALEQVLRCLDLAGSRHDAWPALQKELCEDLRKMLVLHRSDVAAAYLQTLMSRFGQEATLRSCGDPKSLQRALEPLSGPGASALKASLATQAMAGQ